MRSFRVLFGFLFLDFIHVRYTSHTPFLISGFFRFLPLSLLCRLGKEKGEVEKKIRNKFLCLVERKRNFETSPPDISESSHENRSYLTSEFEKRE